MTIVITVSKKKLIAAALLIFLAVGGVNWVRAQYTVEYAVVCIRNSDGRVRVIRNMMECQNNETQGLLGTGQAFNDLNERAAALEDLLMHFSRSGSDITISGANLRVVNGLNNTNTTNALGNVIIGYNELRGVNDDRSGSHMLVVGKQNNYSNFGGLVGGAFNQTSGAFSSVSGGQENLAAGDESAVSSGDFNFANGDYSAVSGGAENVSWSDGSSISGGWSNVASGPESSISGGGGNRAEAFGSSVSGGERCIIREEYGWGVGIPGRCNR